MQKLLDKTGSQIADLWNILPADFADALPGEHGLAPLSYWQTKPGGGLNASAVGLWLEGDTEAELVADYVASCECIGIHFATFMDGRGFSLARLIRERYAYTGELRAFGSIIPDQLFFLGRCGFDTFLLDADHQPDDPSLYLDTFSVRYQTCSDQARPLFRRRA